jgi:hypothetical protein
MRATQSMEMVMNASAKTKPHPAATLKADAKAMIDQLPDKGLSWERLAYHMSVRGDIEAGMADARAGRVYTTEQVRAMFGLP